MEGGFAIEHKAAAAPEDCALPWTAPVANCALEHCTGESELAGEARSTASSRAPARLGDELDPEAATDYPATTIV